MRRLPPGSSLHLAWLALVLGVVLALLPAAAAVGDRGARADTLGALVRAAATQDATAAPHRQPARVAATSAHLRARPLPGGTTRPKQRAIDPELAAHLLVHVPSKGLAAHVRPWASSRIAGTVVGDSRYYHVPLVVWVEATSPDGAWGRVHLPYVWPRKDGWIPLKGLRRETTAITVRVDLSAHRVDVFKAGKRLFRVTGATGSPYSPTPTGDYVVTDRVPFWRGSALGSFAFGISGIQPNLPAGWSGGDQLAIHGTNDPSSIGRSVSAGCVRVSEWSLEHLEPLLRLGTPVLIRR
jgi:hypothetical protein